MDCEAGWEDVRACLLVRGRDAFFDKGVPAYGGRLDGKRREAEVCIDTRGVRE